MKTNTLKNIRIKRGFTLKDVAQKAGITVTYLCMCENGQRKPSDKVKIKLANVYGVAPNTIFLSLYST